MQQAAALVKRLNQSWLGGTGNGACDTSTKGNNKPGTLCNWQTCDGAVGLLAHVKRRVVDGRSHGMGVGGTARVYGLGLGFDGLQTITSVTTNTFNYSNAGSNASGTPPATALCDGFNVLFSQSYASPTLPSGWTVKQCLGSVLTDGSANIRPFTQIGANFILSTQIATSITPQSVSRGLTAIGVPLGVPVTAKFHAFYQNGGGGAAAPNILRSRHHTRPTKRRR